MNRNNKGAFSGYQYIFSLCKAMSYVMDETYLRACVRSIDMNPVRAGLVVKPEQWPWNSASPHISGYDDILVKATHCLKYQEASGIISTCAVGFDLVISITFSPPVKASRTCPPIFVAEIPPSGLRSRRRGSFSFAADPPQRLAGRECGK